MEGVIGLHIVDPLQAIEPSDHIHLAAQHHHLMPPATNVQILNLNPFVDGRVIFPDIVLCFFATCKRKQSRQVSPGVLAAQLLPQLPWWPEVPASKPAVPSRERRETLEASAFPGALTRN